MPALGEDLCSEILDILHGGAFRALVAKEVYLGDSFYRKLSVSQRYWMLLADTTKESIDAEHTGSNLENSGS